ncbi:MAG TPA: hypothetical protein VGR37_23160 [Longimicrobiaceae bacterium]|nr:hypothetical protein [Longimicrobiaceae bacterium]
MKTRLALLIALCLLLPLGTARAQVPASAPAEGALRVFFDCNSFLCDFDFFRREIDWVDYMRDRQDADVHVLVTTQPTGGGGTEFTLRFIGQRRFAGRDNLLRYTSRQTDSEDQVRRGLLRVLKAGLVPYAVDTPAGERIQIGYAAEKAAAATPAAPVRDPWNYWTFSVGVNGFFNGEQTYSSMNLNGSASANRTTEALKINLGVNNRYSEQSFELRDGRTITNIQRNYGVRGLAVWSLGANWSAGGRASATSSTFLNQDLAVRIAPAIEFNVFPYAQSSERQLTLQYSPGVNHFDYEELTIFGETEEMRFDQTLRVSYDVKQPWGSINTSAEAAHFFHDLSKNRLELGGGVNLRLVKGLQFRVSGNAARVRDQLYLPAGNLPIEEILLRQRQLQTAYRYFGSVGLSYTFGSIFNNVVNPRFGNTGGGGSCFCF